MTPLTHLLYLHGFRSSPQSFKARKMADWVAEHRPDVQWWCPHLPPSPHEALALIEAGMAGWPDSGSAVIGSSLGGYYATVIANRRGWPAVLLNPAVDPARDLERYIGEQTTWQNPAERFFFRAEYIPELEMMQPGSPLHPERCLAIIAKGDEVLDWCEMHMRYQHCRLKMLERSDHALSDFDAHMPDVLRFLSLLSSTDSTLPTSCV